MDEATNGTDLEPGTFLGEIAAIRRRVRADRHAVSGPLVVMGLVALAGSLLELAGELRIERALRINPDGLASSGLWTGFYWSLAIPLGFAALTVLEWWRWRRRGIGGSGKRYAWIAAAAAAAFGVPFVWLAVYFTGPFFLIGGGLLAAGVLQRQRALAVAGAIVGLVGTSEGFYWITNDLPAPVWQPWAHQAAYVAIAALTIAAGLVALLRERSAA